MKELKSVRYKQSGATAILLNKVTENSWYVIQPDGTMEKKEQVFFDWATESHGDVSIHEGLTKEQITAWTRYCLTGSVDSLANKKMGVRIPSMNRMGTSEIKYRNKFEHENDRRLFGLSPAKRKKVAAQLKKAKAKKKP